MEKEYFIEYMYHGERFLYRDIIKSSNTPQDILDTFKSEKENLERITVRLNNFVVAFWKSF